jgi:hypothetical protein
MVLFVDFLVWLAAPAEGAAIRLVRVRNPLWLLGCVFLIVVTGIGVWEMLMPHLESRRRLLGVLLLLSLGPALRTFQIYTDLGVFLLDGSEYWIARAANTADPAQARTFLTVVLSATQYGVNEAENQVLANYAPSEQVRLFRLLSEIAPNENWRDRYLARCRTAELGE